VESARLVTVADVATPLLVLTTVYVLFFAIQTTLLYSIVDFMAPAAVTMAFKHFAEVQNTDASTIVILLAGSVAFSSRIYMCFKDGDDYHGVLYTSESDSDQPQHQQAPTKLQQVALFQDEAPEV